MELIKAHNDSIEGNEAVRQINIEMITKEIKELTKPMNAAFENGDIEEFDEYQDRITELEEMLEEV